MWAVANRAARTDGGAWSTAGCDIHSLADPDWAADLGANRATHLSSYRDTHLDADPATDLDAAAADSTGHCC